MVVKMKNTIQSRWKTSDGISYSANFGRDLPLGAKEEEGDGAGAGVGADDRSNIPDENIGNAEFFLHQIADKFCIFKAIAVAYEDNVVLVRVIGLLHMIHKGYEGFFAAPHLGDCD